MSRENVVTWLFLAAILWKLQEVMALVSSSIASKAPVVTFSSLSSDGVAILLSELGLTLMRGMESDLSGLPAPGNTSTVDCFTWTPYPTEDSGTVPALKHLKAQLRRLGVVFGSGGYDIVDLHAYQALLSFTVSGVRYTGGVDGIIVPHRVMPQSAVQQARVLIKLKSINLSNHLAQSIAEFIGASVRCAHLCLYLLTDGTTCNVMRICGNVVTCWEAVPLKKALLEVTKFLCTPSAPRVDWGLEDLASADPATAATLARLREATAERDVAAELEEQFDGLADALPNDTAGAAQVRRLQLAEQLVTQWQHELRQQDLPLHIHELYS